MRSRVLGDAALASAGIALVPAFTETAKKKKPTR